MYRLPPENAAVIQHNGQESKLPQETDWCSIALAAGFAQSSAIETLCYRDFYGRLSETRFTAAYERVR